MIILSWLMRFLRWAGLAPAEIPPLPKREPETEEEKKERQDRHRLVVLLKDPRDECPKNNGGPHHWGEKYSTGYSCTGPAFYRKRCELCDEDRPY